MRVRVCALHVHMLTWIHGSRTHRHLCFTQLSRSDINPESLLIASEDCHCIVYFERPVPDVYVTRTIYLPPSSPSELRPSRGTAAGAASQLAPHPPTPAPILPPASLSRG